MTVTLHVEDIRIAGAETNTRFTTAGAAFIPQIKSAYAKIISTKDRVTAAEAEIIEAKSSAVSAAIECGNVLKLAKENVEAVKINWTAWLRHNCPDIPKSTADLYMRLAEHEPQIKDCASIRVARKKLTTTPREPTNAVSHRGPKARGIAKAPASADLATTLANVGPDELFDVLKKTFEEKDLRTFANRLVTTSPRTGSLSRCLSLGKNTTNKKCWRHRERQP
jgi:hypothetical protein